MKTLTYKISKKQFLGDIEPFKSTGLPTNSIIYKEITGCGATTLELEFERNSIIIEPNLPVILGKAAKMNQGKRKLKVMLAVHEEVSVEQIRSYITNRKGYKKIVTTPEGFDKVLEAIGATAFKDYFLLFDECEKVIQDAAFRERITDPMKSFFLFDNKAFVSATPILPSDPRFESFTQVIIQPDYLYKHKITIYPTNNIIFQLKKIIDSYHPYGEETDRKFFIFFKSTQRIKNIIQGLKIEDYAVHCSETRIRDLKSNGISNVKDTIGKSFAKYNFFTNRFFSAVDFDYTVYNCNPIIIMISDPLAIEHTIIDPATEAIQIIGRFRKPIQKEDDDEIIVVKDIYHITNYSSKLESLSNDNIEDILADIQYMHRPISSFRPTSNHGYINKLKSKLFKVEGFTLFNWNSTRNYFMIDNFRDVETTKSYYNSNFALLRKYRSLERFTVDSRSQYQKFLLTDAHLREVTSSTAVERVNTFVTQRLQELFNTDDLDLEYFTFNLDMVRISYPNQMKIIDKYGITNAAKLNYDIAKINESVKQDSTNDNFKAIKIYIKNAFQTREYLSENIVTLLQKGFEVTKLQGYKPNTIFLKRFAKLSKRKNVKNSDGTRGKGYLIISFYD